MCGMINHVRRTTKQSHLSAIVQAWHFSLFRFNEQMPDAKIAFPLETWSRPLGCPRTIWMKTVQQDLKSNNLSWNDAIDVAQNLHSLETGVYSVSKKKSPTYGFLKFFQNGWVFLINFFTHLLYHHFYTRVQIFTHISPTLTKLCHIKRNQWPPTKILHFTRTLTSKFAYWENDVIVDVMSYPTCCWHYKSVYFIVTCHRQRSTKLSTTYANVWTRAFWHVVDILRIIMWTR